MHAMEINTLFVVLFKFEFIVVSLVAGSCNYSSSLERLPSKVKSKTKTTCVKGTQSIVGYATQCSSHYNTGLL